MNRIHAKIGFFALILTLIGSVTVSGVAPPMGVNDGDTFTFVVEKYDVTDNLDNDLEPGLYLGYDNENDKDVYALQGEEYTITFVNATPYVEYEGDDGDEWSVDYEVTFKGLTFEDHAHLDSVNTVSSVDWEAQKTNLQTEIEDFEAELAADDNSTGSASMIDTSTEFGVTATWTNTEGEDTETTYFEIRLEKSTGVVLYQEEKGSYSYEDSGDLNEGSSHVIVKRKGYSLPGEDEGVLDSLPGFEFSSILAAFSLMFIPVVLRRRN